MYFPVEPSAVSLYILFNVFDFHIGRTQRLCLTCGNGSSWKSA